MTGMTWISASGANTSLAPAGPDASERCHWRVMSRKNSCVSRVARARRGIVHIEQGRAVFPSLTVRENISLTARTSVYESFHYQERKFTLIGAGLATMTGRVLVNYSDPVTPPAVFAAR